MGAAATQAVDCAAMLADCSSTVWGREDSPAFEASLSGLHLKTQRSVAVVTVGCRVFSFVKVSCIFDRGHCAGMPHLLA